MKTKDVKMCIILLSMCKYFFDTHVEHTGNMQVNMYGEGIHAGKYGRADDNWVFNLIGRRGMPTAGVVVKATDVFQRLKES